MSALPLICAIFVSSHAILTASLAVAPAIIAARAAITASSLPTAYSSDVTGNAYGALDRLNTAGILNVFAHNNKNT